ncbi:hypothetical protein L3X38_033650 [Prunus dulcis]|uniref:Integrase catalytic domain-containing protein n=1 Tax=Prunus dulcis TaxID=3755 RepID=A0AAD4YW47_PRUDU|nr:hypothetical protein L3X38_033650 [Prunus dulcis]
MANDDGSANTNQSLVSGGSKTTTQIVTLQSDTSNFSAGIKLDENNYSLWHQIIEMKIAGREKHGHLTGDIAQPADTDPTFNKWRASDCQVKSWLFDAMQPNQIKRFIRYDTAKQVWAAIKQTYSDGADEAKIYDLHRRSFIMKQAGASVAKYYSELTEIFQELDQLSPSTMEHPKDIETRRKEVDRLLVYIFLAGLDNNFDQIRGEILRMEPKPELEAAYAHIKRESNRQGTMSEVASEATALATARSRQSRPNNYSVDLTRNRLPMKCTKCGLDNHTIKGCYEIIGYPEGWVHKGRKKDSTRALFASAQSSEETASEPPSGTSGSKALATSGTSCKSSLTCNRSWIIDTGATDHMTSSFTGLHSTKPSSQTHITSANGTTSQVMGEGSLSLTSSLSLDHVLVVPSLDYDLLSVPQIIDSLNCTVCFWPLYCLFQDLLTRTVIGCGTRRGKLYYLDLTEDSSSRLSQTHHVKGDESIRMKKIWLWHRRLGHASFGYLKLLFPDLFSQFAESDFHCETCILAKSHRISYPLRLNKSSLPFMIVHSDVWGPSRVPTISGFKWFMTFIDDCTRMTWVFPLKQKSEVTAKFKLFYQYVATQFDRKITTLRSDNGGEYVNHDLHTFLSQHGIVHQTTCAYTPQQNGVAERKNRHLLEVVRASLFEARMPHHFWGEALCSAAYLINRTLSSTLQYQTPFQTLTTLLPMPSTPNLEPRLFGCVAYVQVYPHQRGKLDPCALRCVFVGYAATQKGYKCFHPPTQTMHVTADVTFHEISVQQRATVVQQDQELLETPDDGSDNFPPTTVPSPIIQSGPEDSPQRTLLDDLRGQAAGNGSLRKFAAGTTTAPNFQTIYGLAQCTPDLTEQDCRDCLGSSLADIPECCQGKVGARISKPSCDVRYEIYRYVDPETVPPLPSSLPPLSSPPPPPLSSPAPPSTSTGGSKSNRSQIVIIIVVPIVVSVVLIVIFFCICLRVRRTKKKLETRKLIQGSDDTDEIGSAESLQFDLATIRVSTDDFSEANKLGQGGFGSVYRVLPIHFTRGLQPSSLLKT